MVDNRWDAKLSAFRMPFEYRTAWPFEYRTNGVAVLFSYVLIQYLNCQSSTYDIAYRPTIWILIHLNKWTSKSLLFRFSAIQISTVILIAQSILSKWKKSIIFFLHKITIWTNKYLILLADKLTRNNLN